MLENYVRVGEFRCFPLSDGKLVYPTAAVFPERSDVELAEALAPDLVQPQMSIGYSALLIDTGKQRILVDTGAGSLGPDTGYLSDSIRAYGFTPEEIDLVVISHLHPDHIGGLVTAKGELRFPKAEVLLSHNESDFWMSETNQAKLQAKNLLGLGDIEQVMFSWIRNNIPPLVAADKLRLIERDCEPTTGILVLPSFGHTPGHLSLLVSSGREQLLFAGDAIVHPAQVKYPHWNCVFDVFPGQTVTTRLQILDRSASDRCLTYHFHFPFPCLGFISRWNSGYQWEPLEI
jgi:glyoxylase-like metal-dependent hydrolase (beta-lactamase superfamily II)